MLTKELIAQIVGLIAMAFTILSYQGKKQSTVIALQLMGSVFFGLNYLLLGAIIGALMNVIGIVRALVYLFKDKLKADRLPWFIFFIATYIAAYVLNFTVFGKEPTLVNFLVELLPVIGMVGLNVGYRLKNAGDIRKCALVSSPSWLIYNIVVGSWGAILCEAFSLVSVFIGMLRHDRKKKD